MRNMHMLAQHSTAQHSTAQHSTVDNCALLGEAEYSVRDE